VSALSRLDESAGALERDQAWTRRLRAQGAAYGSCVSGLTTRRRAILYTVSEARERVAVTRRLSASTIRSTRM
jgi:hypothetical protein